MTWAVNKVSDPFGNTMTMEYWEDPVIAHQRPVKIRYTGNEKKGLVPKHEVRFNYQDRVDTQTGFLEGGKSQLPVTLQTLQVYTLGQLVREYRFNYGETDYRTSLTQITECGALTCKNPLDVAYQASTPGFNGVGINLYPYSMYYNGRKQGEFADLNGDNLLDILISYHGATDNIHAFINRGGTFTQDDGFVAGYSSVLFNKNNDIPMRQGEVVDLNLDGYDDILISNHGTNIAYINNGIPGTGKGFHRDDSFVAQLNAAGVSLYYTDSQRTKASPDGPQGRMVDVNGDGRVDFLLLYHNGKRLFLNDGKQFYEDTSGYLNAFIQSGQVLYSHFNPVGEIVDFNEDGLPDIWISALYPHGNTVYFNTGSGFVRNDSYAGNIGRTLFNDSRRQGIVADFNNDGLEDVLMSYQLWDGARDNVLYLNTGQGFIEDSFFVRNIGHYLYYKNSDDAQEDKGTVVDINGDGLMDIWFSMQEGGEAAYINNGREFMLDNAAIAGAPGGIFSTTNRRGDWADLNGDGFMDKLYSANNSNGLYLKSGLPYGFATNFSHGFGSEITITYRSMMDKSVYNPDAPQTAIFPVVNVRSPGQVVSQVVTHNGKGQNNTLKYQYVGLKHHLQGRGMLGFGRMIIENINSKMITHQRFSQEFPFIGKVQRADTYYGISGFQFSIRRHSINTWVARRYLGTSDTANLAAVIDQEGKGVHQYAQNSRFLILLNSTREENNGVDGFQESFKTINYTGYDTYGNVTQVETVVGPIGGGGGTIKTENLNPQYNLASDFLGHLTYQRIQETADGLMWYNRVIGIVDSKFDPVTGVLVEMIREPLNTIFRQSTTYEYDEYGLPKSTTLSGNNISYVLASPQVSGVISRKMSQWFNTAAGRGIDSNTPEIIEQDAMGNIESKIYDAKTGALLQTKDANDLVSTMEYDEFGRILKQSQANGDFQNISYHECLGDCPSQAAFYLKTLDRFGNQSWNFIDPVGNTVRNVRESFEGSKLLCSDTLYNHLGYVYRSYLNYPCALNSPLGSHTLYTEYVYDTHGQLIKQIDPDGKITQIDYATQLLGGRKIVITEDGLGKKLTTIKKYDSYGRLMWLEDIYGKINTYVYDGRSRLVFVMGDFRFLWGYDVFDRLSETDDPSGGNRYYKYNVFGDLIWLRDGNRKTTTMDYDAAGRMVSKTVPEFGTIQWAYDQGFMAKNKLVKISTPNYRRQYAYDALGRVQSKVIDYGGSQYRVGNSYDPNTGLLSGLNYPSNGLKLRYGYNNKGYLQHICQVQYATTVSCDATASQTLWMLKAQNDYFQMTEEQYGNNLNVSRTYDNKTGRLLTLGSGSGLLSNVQDLGYQYDAMGNLLARQDKVAGVYENYQYDKLNRVTMVNQNGILSREYAYDNRGNITKKSDKGDVFTYGTIGVWAFQPDAVKTITRNGNIIATYTYDGNGDMLSGDGRTISYTAFNKPAVISVPGESVSYDYDGDFSRIRKTSSTSTITYIGDLYEKIEKGGRVSEKFYVYAYGRRVAEIHKENLPQASIYPVLTGIQPIDTTRVTLHGVNIGKATSVSFNGYAAVILNAPDNDQLRVALPVFPNIEGPVVVVTPYGIAQSKESYQKPGNAAGLLGYAQDAQNQTIPVFGNLLNPIKVTLGGVVYPFNTLNSSQITLSYTQIPSAGKIVVYQADGSMLTSLTDYQPPPMLSTAAIRYIHTDHLGSTDVITNEQGEVIDRQSFDAFGSRRTSNYQALSTRGFTGHEMDDEVGLINMGGRLYDPSIGRFISADPTIAYMESTQGLNRYAYTENNPLTRTDPDGYSWVEEAWRDATHSVKKMGYLRAGLSAHFGYWPLYTRPVRDAFRENRYLRMSATTAAGVADFYGCMGACSTAWSAYATDIQGGDFTDVARSAAVSYLSYYAYDKVGNSLADIENPWLKLPMGAVSHGIVGGVSSRLAGGKFAGGFYGGVFGYLAPSTDEVVTDALVAGVFGGTGARLGGGEFEDGFVTGVAGRIFNHWAHKLAKWLLKSEGKAEKGAGAVKASKSADDIFKEGRTPKASELKAYAESQGWKPTQTQGGPLKYVDEKGIPRITIKQGSSRTPGSGSPHVELKNASGQRIDPYGNPVTRKNPGNHTPIDYDL